MVETHCIETRDNVVEQHFSHSPLQVFLLVFPPQQKTTQILCQMTLYLQRFPSIL